MDAFNSSLHLIRQNYKCQQKSFQANEWKLIKPDVIHQQKDAICSGVWCCVNVFNIIHEQDFICFDEDIPMRSYWIAEEVMSERENTSFKDNVVAR